MECQFACRAVLYDTDISGMHDHQAKRYHEGGKEKEYAGEATLHSSGVLEWLMKGKWHAKITLNKLLTVDPKTERTRLDFVTEKLFDDALFFSSLGLGTDDGLHSVPLPCALSILFFSADPVAHGPFWIPEGKERDRWSLQEAAPGSSASVYARTRANGHQERTPSHFEGVLRTASHESPHARYPRVRSGIKACWPS